MRDWHFPILARLDFTAYDPVRMCTETRFGIDEDLRFLSPTLWHAPRNSPNILKQVWFAGIHCSIAGGYAPQTFGDISLCWMISEVATLTDLEFDKEFLLERLKKSAPLNHPWGAVPEPPYPLLADRLAYAFGPKLKRTPGDYPPPPNGYVSNEFYHHSVSERLAARGYPQGKPVVARLQKLPYTKMEHDLAVEAGLTTPEQVKEYWEV